MTPLKLTIDPNCVAEIQDNAAQWLAEVQAWSEARYPKVDLGESCVITIVPFERSRILMQPQHRPINIEASEIDDVSWPVELAKEQWFTSSLYYVGRRVGLQTAFAGTFRSVQHTIAKDLGDDAYRENWDRVDVCSQERLDWLRDNEPDLLQSWVDRSGWMDQFRKGIRKNRWQFPALNPKLCRSGSWGTGGIFPENSGRS